MTFFIILIIYRGVVVLPQNKNKRAMGSKKETKVLEKAVYEWAEEILPADHVELFLSMYQSKTQKAATTQVSFEEFEDLKNEILHMIDVS